MTYALYVLAGLGAFLLLGCALVLSIVLGNRIKDAWWRFHRPMPDLHSDNLHPVFGRKDY